jgi:hypothetical protein
METITSQIKINLPMPLKVLVKKKADKYGLTLAMYTKYLMINDLEEETKPSNMVIKSFKQAKKNIKKFVKVEDTNDFFDKL